MGPTLAWSAALRGRVDGEGLGLGERGALRLSRRRYTGEWER